MISHLDGIGLMCFLRDYREAVAVAQEVSDIAESFPYVDENQLLDICIEWIRLSNELLNAATYNPSQGGVNGGRLAEAVVALTALVKK